MDKVKLNHTYNQLKELVGPNGSFILMLCAREEDNDNAQILTHGSLLLNIGLLDGLGAYTHQELGKKLAAKLTHLPKQPD